MTDPESIARALASLASGTRRVAQSESGPEPAVVIDDAEAAVATLSRAATFFDADGEQRLRRAVRLAEQREQPELATRGRNVLKELTAFKRAAIDGDGQEAVDTTERTTSTPLAQRSSEGES